MDDKQRLIDFEFVCLSEWDEQILGRWLSDQGLTFTAESKACERHRYDLKGCDCPPITFFRCSPSITAFYVRPTVCDFAALAWSGPLKVNGWMEREYYSAFRDIFAQVPTAEIASS